MKTLENSEGLGMGMGFVCVNPDLEDLSFDTSLNKGLLSNKKIVEPETMKVVEGITFDGFVETHSSSDKVEVCDMFCPAVDKVEVCDAHCLAVDMESVFSASHKRMNKPV